MIMRQKHSVDSPAKPSEPYKGLPHKVKQEPSTGVFLKVDDQQEYRMLNTEDIQVRTSQDKVHVYKQMEDYCYNMEEFSTMESGCVWEGKETPTHYCKYQYKNYLHMEINHRVVYFGTEQTKQILFNSKNYKELVKQYADAKLKLVCVHDLQPIFMLVIDPSSKQQFLCIEQQTFETNRRNTQCFQPFKVLGFKKVTFLDFKTGYSMWLLFDLLLLYDIYPATKGVIPLGKIIERARGISYAALTKKPNYRDYYDNIKNNKVNTKRLEEYFLVKNELHAKAEGPKKVMFETR